MTRTRAVRIAAGDGRSSSPYGVDGEHCNFATALIKDVRPPEIGVPLTVRFAKLRGASAGSVQVACNQAGTLRRT